MLTSHLLRYVTQVSGRWHIRKCTYREDHILAPSRLMTAVMRYFVARGIKHKCSVRMNASVAKGTV